MKNEKTQEAHGNDACFFILHSSFRLLGSAPFLRFHLLLGHTQFMKTSASADSTSSLGPQA